MNNKDDGIAIILTDNVRIINGIIRIDEDKELSLKDYISLLFSVVGGNVDIIPETKRAFWIQKKLVKKAKKWDWKEFLSHINGHELSDVWSEAEWFQHQMNKAYGFENSNEFSIWAIYNQIDTSSFKKQRKNRKIKE